MLHKHSTLRKQSSQNDGLDIPAFVELPGMKNTVVVLDEDMNEVPSEYIPEQEVLWFAPRDLGKGKTFHILVDDGEESDMWKGYEQIEKLNKKK